MALQKLTAAAETIEFLHSRMPGSGYVPDTTTGTTASLDSIIDDIHMQGRHAELPLGSGQQFAQRQTIPFSSKNRIEKERPK